MPFDSYAGNPFHGHSELQNTRDPPPSVVPLTKEGLS